MHRAIEVRKFNIKDMDSLYIAFAESYNIDYFIKQNIKFKIKCSVTIEETIENMKKQMEDKKYEATPEKKV